MYYFEKFWDKRGVQKVRYWGFDTQACSCFSLSTENTYCSALLKLLSILRIQPAASWWE